MLRQFGKDRKGASAIETALLAALIALVVVASAQFVGQAVSAGVEAIANHLDGGPQNATDPAGAGGDR